MKKDSGLLCKAGVYQIQNLCTGDFYIGSSKNVYHRFYQHQGCLRRNEHPSVHLRHAWKKYGDENFYFSVLEYIDSSDTNFIREREQFYLDSLHPKYNISKDAISPLSTRQSPRSKSHRKHHSDAMRRSEIVQSSEYKNRLSNKIKSLWSDPEYRKHQLDCMNSPDAKKHYADATRIRWKSPEFREQRSLSFKENFLNGNKINSQRGIQTVDDVRKIRELYATGKYSYRSLSKVFGVGDNTIRRVVNRITWNFVD